LPQIKKVLFSITTLVIPALLCAQSGESPVYIEQFLHLNETTKQMFAEIAESQPRWAKSSTERLALRERLFAVTKLANGLEEMAGRTELDLLNKGQSQDKRLKLVKQGCAALDFVLLALGNYVETDDRSFLGFARDGAELVASIKKAI
jgi:hypothetical protein